MSGRGETIRLYKAFLRLRHQFPNKQGRSKLRRWTATHFGLKQLEYDEISKSEGRLVADKIAAQWRKDAQQDLGK